MCNIPYIKILKTPEFIFWLNKEPTKTIAKITARLDMLSIGHLGDYKKFDGLLELRWRNGIRVYCFVKNKTLIIALLGGNKNGQNYDIKKAKKIKEKILNDSCAF